MADRWATYEEAGEAFGLSADAMRKRARRLGWRVTSGNDGKARVLIPDGAGLSPDGRGGRPAGRPDGRADGRADDLLAELRRRAEAGEASAERERANAERERASRERAEDERDAIAAEVIQGRERVARTEGELAGLRVAFEQALGRAQRAEADALASRDAAALAAAQASAADAARRVSEQEREAAAATAEAARGELADLTSGGPLRRAWRAFAFRRGRP